MIMIFFDETGDSKFKEYFGICCVRINSAFYTQVKREFQSILESNQWDTNIEFKGSHLFSANSGDTNITIDQRINIAESLIGLNTANKNARICFSYFSKVSTDHRSDYLEYLPILLDKALPKVNHKNGKDIVTIHCDNRSDISINEVRESIMPIISSNEYTLFEDVSMPNSRFETVGLLYADLIGYLIARVETISSDAELFENIPQDQWENNGKVKKLKSSTKLLQQIKNINLYKVKGSQG